MGILDKFGFKKGSGSGANVVAGVNRTEVQNKQAETLQKMQELVIQGRTAYDEDDMETCVSCFLKAYEMGSSEAAYLLGDIYMEGYGCDIDEKRAVSYYSYAAEQSEPYGQYVMGKVYLYGLGGTEYDFNRALECFERAMTMGYQQARPLVYWLREKLKVKQTFELNAMDATLLFDFLEEECWIDDLVWQSFRLQSSVAVGDLAKYRHAIALMGGDGGHEFRKSSRGEFKELAEAGYPDPFLWLGHFFRHGWLVQKDYKTALEYYQKAKQMGLDGDVVDDYIEQMKAMVANNGRVTVDPAELFARDEDGNAFYTVFVEAYRNCDYELLSVLAKYIENHEECYTPEVAGTIGRLYHWGYGCYERDEVQALRWYKISMDAGFYEEAYYYGMLLERGDSVVNDTEEPRRVYALGAYYGDDKCRRRLRICKLAEKYPKMAPRVETLKPASNTPRVNVLRESTGERAREYVICGNKASLDDCPQVAFLYYEAAYRVGKTAEAANLLANAYLDGIGCEKNEARAVELYSYAAEQNEPYACHAMGKACLYGLKGATQDLKLALQYFEKAHANGHHWSKTLVYWLRDKLELEQTITMTNRDVENLLSRFRDMGLVEEWTYYASEWAGTGNIHAKYVLAVALTGVYGGYTNRSYSLRLFKELATDRQAEANYWLGNFYRYGWEVERDLSEALKYYEKAKHLGYEKCDAAMAQVQEIITSGGAYVRAGSTGSPEVEKETLLEALDEYQSAEFYEKVSTVAEYFEQNGFVGSVLPLLAFLYRTGYGYYTQDEAAALACYKKALEQQQWSVCYDYGMLLEFGSDEVVDRDESYRVYTIGAKHGDCRCVQRLRALCYVDEYQGQFFSYEMSWIRTFLSGAVDVEDTTMWDFASMSLSDRDMAELIDCEERLPEHIKELKPDYFYDFGNRYMYGIDAERDYFKSRYWYWYAAQRKCSDACYQLAQFYMTDFVGDFDLQKAREWLEEGMRQLENPQDEIGMTEEDFDAMLEQLDELEWLEAHKADAEVMSVEELMERFNQAMERDWNHVAFAYGKLLEKQNIEDDQLCTYLGGVYTEGLVAKPCPEKALKYFRQAIKEENEIAYYFMGCLYRDGFGVEKNLKKAKACFLKADALGYEEAEHELEELDEIEEEEDEVYSVDKEEEYKEDNKEECEEKYEEVVQEALPEETEAESAPEERKESETEKLLPENLDGYFDGIIGMESVKQQLVKIYSGVKIKLLRDKAMKEKGETPIQDQMGYNFIILGNPGTGKTTIARIIAKILYDINIREKDTLEEVDRSKLVSEHVGGTEKKVIRSLDNADGGTLFIDEAYALYREESGNDFGREAIDTLLKEMEMRKQSLSVIIAGYKEPMMNMIRNANNGFASRFTYTIELPDYSEEELIQIAKMIAKEQNCNLGEKVEEAIRKCIRHDKIDDTFGNARYIHELVHKAIQNQAERLQNQAEFTDADLFTLKSEDFWNGDFEEKGVKEYLEDLNSLTGLASVKEEVNSLIQRISVRLEMEKRGLPVMDDLGTLHMAFKGNPGTGKTTVARIIGKLYAAMGVLKRGEVFVECSRASIVGQYQGHTAVNVKKVVQSAMGGILFIDEAYSLVQGPNDTFGREAVDTLVAEMENNRKNLVVIFAGYSTDMDEFFENNQGLRSRVPIELMFEDYSEEELTAICINMLKNRNFVLENTETEEKLRGYIKDKATQKDFGNARGVRNLVDGIIRKQNVRLASLLQEDALSVTDAMLTMICCQDID